MAIPVEENFSPNLDTLYFSPYISLCTDMADPHTLYIIKNPLTVEELL